MRITLTHCLFFISLLAFGFLSLGLSAKSKKSSSKKYSKSGSPHISARKKRKGHSYARRKPVHYLPVDPATFANEDNVVIDPDTLGHIYYSKIFDIPVDTTANIKLFHTVENWIGTPYRLGGSNHWGIDCSQFAKKLYASVSDSFIGQTCREIITRVKKLTKLELKPGDFVFFKIHGKGPSHMGVYLGADKFVHSSTSKGVMISSLEDPYFEKHFLVGGRVEDQNSESPGLNNSLTN